MKHFKLIGPKTTREFDIEDNQMIEWNVLNIKEYEDYKLNSYPDNFPPTYKEQNVKIYPTEKND